MGKKGLETDKELCVYRFKNGIKLTKPTAKHNPNHTVENLLKLPFSFYLLDSESKTQKINEEGAEVCGFSSATESKDKTILAVSEKQSASILLKNCETILTTEETKIFEEIHVRKNGLQQQFLSIKSPWYDDGNNLTGICGFSIVLGRHALADALSFITQLGILNPPKTAITEINGISLSKREIECLHLTIKGFTAKKIARQLSISHRTVEEYLTNIKMKLSVNSKSDLIALASSYF